jgi:hypothetical protein
MFIAVINENFEVAEEAKKSKQASNFWATQTAREGKPSWMRVLNPYRWFRANPVTVRVDELPSGLVLPMQKNLVMGYGGILASGGSSTTAVPSRSGSDSKEGGGTEELLGEERAGMSSRLRATGLVSNVSLHVN